MPSDTPSRNESWLRNPLRSQFGDLILAGRLYDRVGIDPESMRVLGDYALIYVLHGSGHYSDANGRSQQFKTGDAILVFPDIPHAYGPAAGESWEQIYVIFNGPQFDLLRGRKLLDPGHPVWHLEPPDYWRRRMEDIFHNRPRRTPTAALRAMGQWVHLLSDMAASEAEARSGPANAWLEESLHLLAERAERGWLSPQEVAQRVGLSYENFRKRFAESTGESPGQFQKRRRIEQACAAIYQGSHSFKELAGELGFCDAFHFSKVFRQIVGETPSEFRKKVRGR